jgi:hypothetical protein
MPGPVPTSPTPYTGSQTPYRPFSGANTPPGPKKRPSDCLEIDLCDDLYGWFRYWGQEAQPFLFYWWRWLQWQHRRVDGTQADPDEKPPESDWQWIVPTYEAEKESA